MKRAQKCAQNSQPSEPPEVGKIIDVEWTMSKPTPQRGRFYTDLFRSWHRSMLLGLEVETLTINGREVSELGLRRLNFWIQAYGAWRCSTLPYWEGHDALLKVLDGNMQAPKVGAAGGGRIARLAEAEE